MGDRASHGVSRALVCAKRTCTTLNLSNPGQRFSSKISFPERSFATTSVPVVMSSVFLNERGRIAVLGRVLASRGLASRGASRAPGSRVGEGAGEVTRGAPRRLFPALFAGNFLQALVLNLTHEHHSRRRTTPCPPPSVASRRSASGLPCAPPHPPRGPPLLRSRPSRRTASPRPQVRPSTLHDPSRCRP